jgi:hypothetical protein
MPNRFSGRIRRGEIGSVEELKSEFKTLAKASHPDLAAPGSSGEDFLALRAEYEAALRDFTRLKCGLGRSRPSAAGLEDGGGTPFRAFDRSELYASLLALRKRGFPKTPRHEKERMRYEYCRFLALSWLSAWEGARAGMLEGFEAAILGSDGGKGLDEGLARRALGLLDSLLAWHGSGGDDARSCIEIEWRGIVLDFAALAPAHNEAGGLRPGPGNPESLGLLSLLVKDLERGPALVGQSGASGR